MASKVKKVNKRTKKKSAIVGTHPITGKPETQEDRDRRLKSVDYPPGV
tara:strand:+ start:860 stop:1003 length:144 start_codon:yes stop_codon:yes gene_type:complete